MKALVVEEKKPGIRTATASRATICRTVKLETEADVDKYVAEIKKTLMDKLSGNDVLHII